MKNVVFNTGNGLDHLGEVFLVPVATKEHLKQCWIISSGALPSPQRALGYPPQHTVPRGKTHTSKKDFPSSNLLGCMLARGSWFRSWT